MQVVASCPLLLQFLSAKVEIDQLSFQQLDPRQVRLDRELMRFTQVRLLGSGRVLQIVVRGRLLREQVRKGLGRVAPGTGGLAPRVGSPQGLRHKLVFLLAGG